MLKEYSFQIRKNIAVFLHAVFLILAVAGITLIYLNSHVGTGIMDILHFRYEDSEQFQEQFQADLNQVFKYISCRDVFETDGMLDLSKEMFSIRRSDSPEIIYTLDEVLRYAKSQGFYLNDKFEVVNDLFIYDNASTSKDQIVNWRAYPTDQQILEPADTYTSLLDLTKEVLDCLSDYYSVHYRLIVNPSNFLFQIAYFDADDDVLLYSNCAQLSAKELCDMGRYCYLDSESAFVKSNLSEIPRGLAAGMEKNNLHETANYYIAAAVDTDFAADDDYAEANKKYDFAKSRCLEGAATVAIGIFGCLITLYYLIVVSGYRTKERTAPTTYSFDEITTEACICLTGICTLFMLFLEEKAGSPLIHILLDEAVWNYAERMLKAVIIYTCCMTGAFSLLRRYKSGQLWRNSALHALMMNIQDYFSHRTFSYRLFCLFLAFITAQVIGIAGICGAVHFRHILPAKIIVLVLAAALAIIDYSAYHTMFRTATQEDLIADAIEKIAGGDTSYQMDLNGLNGRELVIARQINRIGIGLERALQEQVKSERMKADLITNVSHDIKTPLTSIISYVDLIKREKIPNEKLQGYLTVLEQKSQRLKTLTEDLVEASKASSGNLKLEMAHLNLVQMIWQTNGEFGEKYAERQLELVSTLPDSNLVINADGRYLWRILENLYNNAFKYAMAHSRVYTEVAVEGKNACFTIKNISEQPLNISSDELTERFVRGDVSRTTEGSGLGLSIAQSLTKLLGGTFEIIIDGDLFKVKVCFPLVDET